MATPRTQPVELHEHAMDNLKYIRQTLERAGSFTAVPGKGGVLMGLVAWRPRDWPPGSPAPAGWLAVWTVAAVMAMAIGLVGRGAQIAALPDAAVLRTGTQVHRRFRPGDSGRSGSDGWCFYRAGVSGFLPGVWLLLYGAAVLSGGWASVRIVPMMGACFMLVGTVALLLPGWNDVLLPVGFGGLHVIFGTVIAVKYGG